MTKRNPFQRFILFLSLLIASLLMAFVHRRSSGTVTSAYFLYDGTVWKTLFSGGFASNLKTGSGVPDFWFITNHVPHTLFTGKSISSHQIYWIP